MNLARAAALLAVLPIGAVVPACSGSQECEGAASVDVGVASGTPTARAALDALLADRPKWMSTSGWEVSSTAQKPDKRVTYRADGDEVTVFQDRRNQRWYLDSYRGCR